MPGVCSEPLGDSIALSNGFLALRSFPVPNCCGGYFGMVLQSNANSTGPTPWGRGKLLLWEIGQSAAASAQTLSKLAMLLSSLPETALQSTFAVMKVDNMLQLFFNTHPPSPG
jgi:hypothetical protein